MTLQARLVSAPPANRNPKNPLATINGGFPFCRMPHAISRSRTLTASAKVAYAVGAVEVAVAGDGDLFGPDATSRYAAMMNCDRSTAFRAMRELGRFLADHDIWADGSAWVPLFPLVEGLRVHDMELWIVAASFANAKAGYQLWPAVSTFGRCLHAGPDAGPRAARARGEKGIKRLTERGLIRTVKRRRKQSAVRQLILPAAGQTSGPSPAPAPAEVDDRQARMYMGPTPVADTKTSSPNDPEADLRDAQAVYAAAAEQHDAAAGLLREQTYRAKVQADVAVGDAQAQLDKVRRAGAA